MEEHAQKKISELAKRKLIAAAICVVAAASCAGGLCYATGWFGGADAADNTAVEQAASAAVQDGASNARAAVSTDAAGLGTSGASAEGAYADGAKAASAEASTATNAQAGEAAASEDGVSRGGVSEASADGGSTSDSTDAGEGASASGGPGSSVAAAGNVSAGGSGSGTTSGSSGTLAASSGETSDTTSSAETSATPSSSQSGASSTSGSGGSSATDSGSTSSSATGAKDTSAAQGTQNSENTITVSVSIDSSRAHAYNASWPTSLGGGTVTLAQGATVYDALCALGLPVSGSAYYVSSINGLAEKACGSTSGWTYCVNGEFPNYACGRYMLKGGENIEWVYSTPDNPTINM